MSRKPRMYLGGIPCHVIQRGNNRNACFYSDQDYHYYLSRLANACQRYHVDLHAYVLRTNHAHLLMTPIDETGISRVMQSLGSCYVQYINKTYRRSGTLWEGRHKSSLVAEDRYLLACYRYIELNPVRANMVDHPAMYRWSSYRFNGLGEHKDWISPHPLYEALDTTVAARLAAYQALFEDEHDADSLTAIRKAASCSMPLGNQRFQQQIEQALERKTGSSLKGRLRNNPGTIGTND